MPPYSSGSRDVPTQGSLVAIGVAFPMQSRRQAEPETIVDVGNQIWSRPCEQGFQTNEGNTSYPLGNIPLKLVTR